jgi:hypothetical protein
MSPRWIRRMRRDSYAQRQLNARTDIVALAQAKAEIRALVERDFNRKSTPGAEASCAFHGRSCNRDWFGGGQHRGRGKRYTGLF